MAAVGCARPTGARVGEPQDTEQPQTQSQPEETPMKQAMVGKPAPDFEAPAYHNGKFTEVKLRDYLDNWTLVCFYPGDFTFV